MDSFNMDIKAGPVLEGFGGLFTLNSKGWFIAVLLFYVNLQVVLSLSFEIRVVTNEMFDFRLDSLDLGCS
jgi:hypothetical protein